MCGLYTAISHFDQKENGRQSALMAWVFHAFFLTLELFEGFRKILKTAWLLVENAQEARLVSAPSRLPICVIYAVNNVILIRFECIFLQCIWVPDNAFLRCDNEVAILSSAQYNAPKFFSARKTKAVLRCLELPSISFLTAISKQVRAAQPSWQLF